MSATLQNLLTQIDQLKQTLDTARPLINDSILSAVNIEYTYDSNRIEGNTLTLRETDIVINKGLTIGDKSMREHLEATNHHEAVLYIRDLVQDDIPFSEKLIKDIHSIILRGIVIGKPVFGVSGDAGDGVAVLQEYQVHHEPGGPAVSVDEGMDGGDTLVYFGGHDHRV